MFKLWSYIRITAIVLKTKDRRNSYAWTKDTAKLQLISIKILGHQNSSVNSKLNKPITLVPVQNDQKMEKEGCWQCTGDKLNIRIWFIEMLLCCLLLMLSISWKQNWHRLYFMKHLTEIYISCQNLILLIKSEISTQIFKRLYLRLHGLGNKFMFKTIFKLN